MRPSTFSIAAFDPGNHDLGIAVESKFPSVGSVVPHARAGVGAVATQAHANVSFGPRGLDLLAGGTKPQVAIEELLASDAHAEMRQVGVVDAKGHAASFTGKECFPWAGHRTGKGYAAQGNILVGQGTIDALAETFESTEGDLADRLLAALTAAQNAGGDRRGQQSAALLVVRAKGGYGGFSDRYVDLRVDDHPKPIEELKRIFQILDLIMLDRGDPTEFVPIDSAVARELQEMLGKRGFYPGPLTGKYDESTRKALETWAGYENLEERLRDGPVVSTRVLQFLRDQVRATRH